MGGTKKDHSECGNPDPEIKHGKVKDNYAINPRPRDAK